MKIVIFGVHLTYLTGLEDYLHRHEIDFLYIGKSISEEYQQHICE